MSDTIVTTREPDEFYEGDEVMRVDRDGRLSYEYARYVVEHASERRLWLKGPDPLRKLRSSFSDAKRWSTGEPKYVVTRGIEHRLAEELMS